MRIVCIGGGPAGLYFAAHTAHFSVGSGTKLAGLTERAGGRPADGGVAGARELVPMGSRSAIPS